MPLLFTTVLATRAEAAELEVVCPPLVHDGMSALAAVYARETGTAVHVKSDVMGKIMSDISAGTPAPDIGLLPPELMDALQKDSGVAPGTRTAVDRVEIALAVRSGAPHPDISTVEKLRSVLGTKILAYTRPGPPRNSMEAGIIDALMHRPAFSDVRTITVATASGVTELRRLGRHKTVTLIYAARDIAVNHALALKAVLQGKARPAP